MFFSSLLLLLGFIFLVGGAHLLITGSATIAKRFNVSTFVIGLTVVAFGTSAPELFVNVVASLQQKSDLVIGNIIGSNIANILLILGLTALFTPVVFKKIAIWRDLPIAFGSGALLLFLSTYNQSLELSRLGGMIFIILFFTYLGLIFYKLKNDDLEEVSVHNYSTFNSILITVAGLVGLGIGAKWIVSGATNIASLFGLSEAVIALSIVALGTSLPELATSMTAVYKKHPSLAVGNIIGSNIFNTLWILGISSIINPLPFSTSLLKDIAFSLVITATLFVFLFIGKKHTLKRWQGGLLVTTYIFYIAYLFLNPLLV